MSMQVYNCMWFGKVEENVLTIFKIVFSRYCMIFNIILAMALVPQVLLAEGAEIDVPVIKCGTLPHGKVLNRTAISKEIAGPRLTLDIDTGANMVSKAVDYETRFVIIKGSKCWVEFSVFVGEYEPKSASESFTKSIFAEDNIRTRGAFTACYSRDLFEQIRGNSNFDECRDIIYPGFRTKPEKEWVFNRNGLKDFERCQKKAARELDSRGFVAYFSILPKKHSKSACSSTYRGFIFMDGNIKMLKED